MQLPFRFTIDLELPHWARPRRAGRSWWVWGLAAGAVAATGLALLPGYFSRPDPTGDPSGHAGTTTLQVTSVPGGARIELDGQARGRTPASLTLRPGDHQVLLYRDGYTEATYRVRLEPGVTTALAADL